MGLLGSRVIWFVIRNTELGLGERAGILRFQLFAQYILSLPVPTLDAATGIELGYHIQALTTHARARYNMHRNMRQRIHEDGGGTVRPLNGKLSAWDPSDPVALRAEDKKAFQLDISPPERRDWARYSSDQQAEHRLLTAKILRLEST